MSQKNQNDQNKKSANSHYSGLTRNDRAYRLNHEMNQK